jgi:hypothetical protein
MPKYIVTVVETTTHRFVVEAPSRKAIEATEAQGDFADACSDNRGFFAVADRHFESIEKATRIAALRPAHLTLDDDDDEPDCGDCDGLGCIECGDSGKLTA